jgi:hypothetical protein
MAVFEGTVQEFHHFIGPRIRDAINNLTRTYRKDLDGVCENCGVKKELHSAHIHGSGRRSIIETVLSNFNNNGIIKCNIDFVEKKILEAHQPVENHFKFLCQPCHIEYDSKQKKVFSNGIKTIQTQPNNVEKTSMTRCMAINPHQGDNKMNIKDKLMVKFYVVNGISYPAAETAVGYFGRHGYESMRICRNVGVENAGFKGSMALEECANLIQSPVNEIDIDPLEYYLENNGFGVVADETELRMATHYIVYATPYVSCEEMENVVGKRGFEAMYAVCKLGAFYGAQDKGSMGPKQFEERRNILNL